MRFVSAAALAVVVLAGCSGGAHPSTTPAVQTPATTASSVQGPIVATFTVQIPPATTASAAKRSPAYVSPSTKLISLYGPLNAAGTSYPFLTSTSCSTTTCSISYGFNPGTYSLTIGLQNAAGSTTYANAYFTATIQPDVANAFSLVFYADIAAITVSATPASAANGTRTTIPLSLAFFDAGGNAISGTGAIDPYTTFTFTDSDTSGATSISPSTLSAADIAAGRFPELVYSGSPLTTTVKIGVTSNQTAFVNGASVAPTVTPASIAFAGSLPSFSSSATAGVTPFEQSGSTFENFVATSSTVAVVSVASAAMPAQLTSPATSFAGTTNGITISTNSGTGTFASAQAPAGVHPLAIGQQSTTVAVPNPNATFLPDAVLEPDTSRLQRSTAGARRSASAATTPPALGATQNWNIQLFAINGSGTTTNEPLPMTLVDISTHGYIWLDNTLLSSAPVSSATATQLGTQFDAVYASDTSIFGSTDYPATAPGLALTQTCSANGTGIPNTADTQYIVDSTTGMVNVLIVNENTLANGGEGGYFSTLDFTPQDIANCYNAGSTTTYISNQAPDIVVGATATQLGALSRPNYVRSTMAHELQHLINFVNHVVINNGAFEAAWLNEGMSMVAEDLTTTSGIDVVGTPYVANYFLAAPQNFSLTAFTGEDPGTSQFSRNCNGCYGQSYLFARYLADRFGTTVMKKLESTSATSVQNVAAATGVDFGTLVGDFDATLAINGLGIAPATSGTKYALSVPIGKTYTAGADELNQTASYNALTTAGTLSATTKTLTTNAIQGAPLFFTLSGFGTAGEAVKIVDNSNGQLIFYPSLGQH